MPANPVAAYLTRVRELLTPEGSWCQKTYRLGPSRCLIGAIRSVSVGKPEDVESAAVGLLRRVTGNIWLHVYNDAPGRTHADILAVLDRAIEIAEGEG